MSGPGPAPADVERVFREEYGRAVAVLTRIFGDLDIAEDAAQDAFAVAVQRWPADGLPPGSRQYSSSLPTCEVTQPSLIMPSAL